MWFFSVAWCNQLLFPISISFKVHSTPVYVVLGCYRCRVADVIVSKAGKKSERKKQLNGKTILLCI